MRGLLAVLAGLAAARLAAADGEWTRSVEVGVDSKLVRRGIERAETAASTAARLTDGSWRFGAATVFPLKSGQGHELRLLGGYTRTFATGWELGLEVTHFHFGEAAAGHPSHTAEVFVVASLPVGPGRLAGGWGRDVNRRADIAELSFSGDYALKNWGAFLNYRFYAGAVEADDVLPQLSSSRVVDSYRYHGADLTLPYRVGGQTVLTAGVHYAGTVGARSLWSPDGAASGGKVWVSLAASYEF